MTNQDVQETEQAAENADLGEGREDWVEIRLDNLVSDDGLFSDGDWVEKKDQDVNGEVRLIQLGDIGDGIFRDKSNKRVKHSWAKQTNCSFLNYGDILIARMPDPLGRAVIFPLAGYEKYITAVDVAILRPNNNIVEQKYLLHLINSPAIRNEIDKLKSGTTRKRISRKNLNKIHFPLAPLPIQRAIVAKIEALFADLDQGITDLQQAQAQLKVYRQAVLSHCFPKIEPIEISQLVTKLSQGWSPKCINRSSDDEKQWAVIKTTAIQAGRFVEYENKILPETLEPREQHEIKKGDILITRAGPRVRVGICCLVRSTRPKLINCDKVYRLELDSTLVDSEYFEHAMNSPEALREIEVMKSGTNDSGLNLTQKAFLKLKIPLPSLPEQHQIVREIESRLSVCDQVEQSITESLDKAQALRQSILKKAFAGKLLSTEEIAACKQEPDYEPASALLAKIRANP